MPENQDLLPPLLPTFSLSLEDQQWINNNIPNSETVLSDSVSGGCKQQVNTELTFSKRNVINKIEAKNYRTPPREIAQLLSIFFKGCETLRENHWLYIAQNWNPRAISRVLRDMEKQYKRGDKSIKNPAAYFTYLIKFRKRRKNI